MNLRQGQDTERREN